MKTFLKLAVSIVFLAFTLLQSTYSQTVVPGGYVSGTWTAAGSPYLIQDNITIHSDSTLTIEPGVKVLFDGYYRLNVAGHLEANGTASDSIYFIPTDTLVGWRGIYYTSSVTKHQLSYCIIKYSFESGIWLQAPFDTLQISHCTIAHCRSESGGGIHFQAYGSLSLLQISHSTIAYNTAESYSGGKGGGIYLFYGTLDMNSCIVHANRAVIPIEDENQAVQGGGIWIGYAAGAVVISGSFITDNFIGLSNGGMAIGVYPPDRGGGIYNGTAQPVTISHCDITGNRANIDWRSGGGIFSDIPCTLTTLSYCNISNNWSRVGAGGYEATGKSNIVNCTFSGNSGRAIIFHLAYSSTVLNVLNTTIAYNEYGFDNYGSGIVTVKYSNIIDNCYNMPSGFGVLDTVNFNGDPCDVYFNIFMDPLFADTANGNYRLTWANWPTPDSTKSPCIDAGDPTSPFDPDGTIADQGAFSFDQNIPVELVSFTAELIQDNVILKWTTATETNNKGFEIERASSSTSPVQGWEKTGFVEGHGTTTEPSTYTYADDITNIVAKSVTYRLKQVDYNGSYQYSNEVSVEINTPLEFKLCQNYPNPFNPITLIKFALPKDSEVNLSIYNVLGEMVTTLVNEEKKAGYYEVNFDAASLASGVYLYRIKAGDFVSTKKMILMK